MTLRSMFSALVAAAGLLAALPAAADSFPSESAASRVITVPKNKSLSFQLYQPAARIVVAQPDTAQIVATTDRSFYVRGKALGSTNLLVYGGGGRLQEVIDVRVGYDAAALESDLDAALPGENIRVRNLGEGLLLTGEVSTTGVAARAKNFADKFAPEAVTSALTVRASQQVILEVRIVEAGRSALQDMGFNVDVAGPGYRVTTGSGLIGAAPPQGVIRMTGGSGPASIDVTLSALEEKGVIRTLARPNLTALSGEKASFLAGGEFPFPVPSGRDMVAIEFRPFGVNLNFTPLVQDNGLIRLQVAPEVSQLDPRNSLRIAGFDVPSLTVRRAETTVELRGGESFAIAGLFQQDYVTALRQMPWIGDVPVLGSLFRSSRWKRQETELIIVVTPRLAVAGDFVPRTTTPLETGREPGPLDLFFNGKALDQPLVKPVTPGWPDDRAEAPVARPRS
jgi:pilus assembly protein CpaC